MRAGNHIQYDLLINDRKRLFCRFVIIGSVDFGGPGGRVIAQQRFVNDEPYRAARQGELVVNKFASRRRFAGWGDWAQERIRVRSLFADIFYSL